MTKRSFIVPLVAAAVLTSVPGCENSEAQERARIQEKIATVSQAFELVSMADANAPDELKALARQLNDVANGEKGQRTAVALLSGSIHREMAGLGLSKIDRIARQQRQQREMIRSEAAAGLRLDTLAGSRESLERSDSRDYLRGERESAQTGLSEYEARVAELDVPISERADANESAAERVVELKEEASRLRRSAAEQGRRTGLPTFEQAVQLEMEADVFEIAMARREGELRYELQPEHDLASYRAAYYTGLIDQIEATSQTLSDHAQSTAVEAARTRDIQSVLRDSIATRLTELHETTQDRLQPLYDDVASSLATAATKVRAADDDSARLALARVHLMQGRLHRGRAQSQTDQAEVLSRLVAAGSALGDPAVFDAARADAEQAANAALAEATAAFTEAQSAIGQVRSKTPGTQAFMLEIDTALARLTGAETPERPAMEAPTAAPQGLGAASPEELLSVLQSESGETADGARRLLALTYASTPNGQQMMAAQQRIVDGMAAFTQAMDQQFGPGSMTDLAGGMVGAQPGTLGASGWAQAQITERTPDRVTLTMPDGMGGETTVMFVAVNERWYVDGDAVAAMLPPEMGSMMDAMVGQMEAMFSSLAQRVAAGEFSSVQDVQAAIMESAGGMIGGAPGMPGGPGQ